MPTRRLFEVRRGIGEVLRVFDMARVSFPDRVG